VFEIVKILCVLVSALIIGKTIKEDCSKAMAFALFAVWLRFALSAFHEFTHEPLLAGLSINALGSIFVVISGIIYLPTQSFLMRKLVPLYLFLFIIILSGLYNLLIIDLINAIVKWAYFLVLALAILLAARIHNLNSTLLTLLKAFYLPVGLLVLSIVLGESKATEQDGSVSFIGGYSHEATVSMVIISFALIISLIDKTYLKYRTILFFFALVLLYLVNYRTALIAVIPMILVFIFTGTQQKMPKKYHLAAFGCLSISVLIGFYIIAGNMSERFSDISLVLANWPELLKAPIYFSQSEKAIFSSRVYIWSQYVSEVYNSGMAQQIIGHGPESWKGVFHIYAHNTYISYLYEYGYVGLCAFAVFIVSIFVNTLKIENAILRFMLLGSLLGFLTMNLATMPLWNIEGLITLAIIYSVVLACSQNKIVKVM
jgi:hypothetical protein